MRFKKLKLFTNNLSSDLKFYSEIFGLQIMNKKQNSFSVNIGWTQLEFHQSDIDHIYHYCFLIPSNQLEQAIKWIEKRTDIIKIDKNKKTQYFESWNAESFYFLDGSGNLAEFIVHYDINDNEKKFDVSQIKGICEVGMPTNNIESINNQLTSNINSEFWKGDLKKFGTNGSIEGKFLLPNFEIKKTWFPTSLKIEPFDFETILENNKKEYSLEFRNGIIKTTANTV